MSILEALVLAAPYFHKLYDGEAIVAVAEKKTETIIKYLAGKRVDSGYVDGQKLNKDDDNIYTAFSGKNANLVIPKEVYGVEIKACAFPVYENNVIVGALGIGFPIDNEVELQRLMTKMGNILKDFQDSVHNLASHSEELAATSIEVDRKAQMALEDAEKSNSITNFIKGISRQTNLLGLNASIEASHAGQQGAGFNIVAQEVRKLALESSKATETIESSLKNINANLTNLKMNMEQINVASNEQAALIQDLNETLRDLADLSEKIEDFMHKIMN